MGRRKVLPATFLIVSLILAGCGGGDGGSGGGGKVLTLSGGAGDNGSGGGSGSITVSSASSDISFRKTGSVDTSFTVPDVGMEVRLGARSAVVTTDCVVPILDSSADPEPAVDSLYMVKGDNRLFKAEGDGVSAQDNDVVTGLKVNAGATLTLPVNYDGNFNALMDHVYLSLSGDLDLPGTLRTGSIDNSETRMGDPATVRDKGSILLSAGRIRIAATGAIVTAGGNGSVAGDRGGDGGAVRFEASVGFVNRGRIDASGGNGVDARGGRASVQPADLADGIYLKCGGTLVNTGALSANGGNGTAGGGAGFIQLVSDASVFNTAPLGAGGGTGSAGSGGSAQYVTLVSNYGSVCNRGTITAMGGNGASGAGTGGNVSFFGGNNYLSGYRMGNVVNAGAITVSGGTDNEVGGVGGAAGTLLFDVYGGSVRNSGDLVATGGDGTGAGSTGGQGGTLNLYSRSGNDLETTTYASSGGIRVTGNIDLSGGAGDNGGTGGSVVAQTTEYNYYTYPATGPVEFLGYGRFELNGGEGGVIGGAAGDVDGTAVSAYISDGSVYLPPGSIFNDVPVQVRGGDASGGQGGHGGYVSFETTGDAYVVSPGSDAFGAVSTVTNEGDIDARGGTGSGATGTGYHGGGLYLFGHYSAVNRGTILGRGGDGTLSGSNRSDDVQIYSTYTAENHGTVDVSGGIATGANGNGGDGGYFSLSSGQVSRDSGSVTANGGNGKGTGTNGNGGEIDIFSSGGASSVSGTLSAVKGTGGAVAGTDGSVWIDLVLVRGIAP